MSSMVDFEGKMSYPRSESLRTAGAASMALSDWRWPLLAATALLVIVVGVFWNFFSFQVLTAISQQADYGHVLVVPFIAGYFVYLHRQQLLAQGFRTSWTGLILVILGVAWYIECWLGLRPLQRPDLQSFGVMTTLIGLIVLFLGWRSLRWLWFPLMYLFIFGQCMSEKLLQIVTFRLQDITAWGAHLLLQVGMDVERDGNTITIFDHGAPKPLNIAEACSGMRMLMAFLALGVAMAYTGFKHTWQQALLILSAVPTAIFINILRVVTLGVLSLADVGFAAGDFHSFIGLVWLVPAFFIFLGLMWIIRHLIVEEQRPAPRAAKGKP